MKTKIYFLVLALLTCLITHGQKPILELTFTAVDNATYVQLDSIKVMNRSQGGDTVLYWPDTVLVLDFPTGIYDVEIEDRGFEVFQNYPNPVTDQTNVSLYVPGKDRVILVVSDMLGRVILKPEIILEKGTHSFRFRPGFGNHYFFTARWRGHSSSIKIMCAGSNAAGTISREYSGSEPSLPPLKASESIMEFSFSPGDELLYIGYADTIQSGMPDTPEESATYTFQFAFNIPCPGTPTITYEGQVYNTVQIFSQCWLKENLNVGTMIPGFLNMTDNDTVEKYCYKNEPDSCTKYGGLYTWNEMMQYTTQQGVRGICPPGWHVPSDEEWKALEGATDSQFGIGDPEWDSIYQRGHDVGTNLKTTSGWKEDGNGIDLFGFSGLPAGYYEYHPPVCSVINVGYSTNWWTSTDNDSYNAWYHGFYNSYPESYRYIIDKDYGFSVRCLRDD